MELLQGTFGLDPFIRLLFDQALVCGGEVMVLVRMESISRCPCCYVLPLGAQDFLPFSVHFFIKHSFTLNTICRPLHSVSF